MIQFNLRDIDDEWNFFAPPVTLPLWNHADLNTKTLNTDDMR